MPENAEKKKFGALARKRSANLPFVTSVIYAESLQEAKNWFGENNYEIDGNVYPYNLKKKDTAEHGITKATEAE